MSFKAGAPQSSTNDSKSQFTQITKNIFSHLPVRVSKHADSCGFLCPGFKILKPKTNGSDWNLVCGAHIKRK